MPSLPFSSHRASLLTVLPQGQAREPVVLDGRLITSTCSPGKGAAAHHRALVLSPGAALWAPVLARVSAPRVTQCFTREPFPVLFLREVLSCTDTLSSSQKNSKTIIDMLLLKRSHR